MLFLSHIRQILTRYIDSNSVEALSSNLHGLDMQCAETGGTGAGLSVHSVQPEATRHAARKVQRGVDSTVATYSKHARCNL